LSEKKLQIHLATQLDSPLVTEYEGTSTQFHQDNLRSDMAVFCSKPEQADIIIIFENCSFKLQSYAKMLSRNPLVKKYFEKIYVINDDDFLQITGGY